MSARKTKEERRALAHAYLDRPQVPVKDGMAMLRPHFPDCPETVLDAASFHLFCDLPGALEDLMAQIELFVRSPSEKPEIYGEVRHLIYHLYNYLLLESLLSTGHTQLIEQLKEVRHCIDNDDPEGARNTLAGIDELLTGGSTPPNIP